MDPVKSNPEFFEIRSRRTSDIPLSTHVKIAVEHYFSQLKDHEITNLYDLVINEVEKPLLEATLEHSGYNQSKAAKTLGLSRSTLRKKLDQYGIG
ncbi:MAG: Fis family transcriptional regulator [Methylobacter sp.]|nr:MAG: Fis family transcriptional regulator [Methylobacter sp.]PPD04896.1 MAG: Fis family transcriptional regulator [Methylobacter sp.]PPD23688.1 MAG: Fis family transcriptional regulator [Methylobacter sp.]PPD32522.1 MAG: Fis family transcriptional regulator [Methylomonas sp.]